jgi:hypothetical protein
LVHVERNPKGPAGDLVVLAELPGIADDQVPHVAVTTARQTPFREHLCPKVKAYSAAGQGRKVKP